MKKIALINLALSLALGALLVMFTPFLREFSSLHIGGEPLALGAFLVGGLCMSAIARTRSAVSSLFIVFTLASLIEAIVIALPAFINLVPNPVSYINLAEQQVFLGCTFAGPFVLAGGVLGGVSRAWLKRNQQYKQ